jgi:hypothetical protein
MSSVEGFKEVARIQNFEEGDFKCLRCGKPFHLFWNGGGLDEAQCCGLRYRTEHVQIDLVVYEQHQENASCPDEDWLLVASLIDAAHKWGCFTATDNEELSGSYLDRVMDIRSKLLGRLWTGDSNEKRCSMQWLHKHTNKENEK